MNGPQSCQKIYFDPDLCPDNTIKAFEDFIQVYQLYDAQYPDPPKISLDSAVQRWKDAYITEEELCVYHRGGTMRISQRRKDAYITEEERCVYHRGGKMRISQRRKDAYITEEERCVYHRGGKMRISQRRKDAYITEEERCVYHRGGKMRISQRRKDAYITEEERCVYHRGGKMRISQRRKDAYITEEELCVYHRGGTMRISQRRKDAYITEEERCVYHRGGKMRISQRRKDAYITEEVADPKPNLNQYNQIVEEWRSKDKIAKLLGIYSSNRLYLNWRHAEPDEEQRKQEKREGFIIKMKTLYRPTENNTLTKFRKKDVHCKFKCASQDCTAEETAVRDQIVIGIVENSIRQEALQMSWDLPQLRMEGMAMESALKGGAELAGESVSKIGKYSFKNLKKDLPNMRRKDMDCFNYRQRLQTQSYMPR